MFDVGEAVTVIIDAEESNLVHAFAGERGTVVLVEDVEWITVTWDRTGTTCTVHSDDLRDAI